MKNKLARYLLKQKNRRNKRKVQVKNLSTAKSALLVYDSTNEDTERRIRKFAHFLIEEGIKTDSLAYYKLKNKKDERPADELGYAYFDQRDLNWLGFPANNKMLKYMAKEYDLLIDLNLQTNFSLSVITSLSSARFKVGLAGGYQDEVCDLTLAIDDTSLDYLIEQISTYLQMINRK